ncbi:MAG: hypothetical protein WC055_16225 [Melioribacteraceae bacterium]
MLPLIIELNWHLKDSSAIDISDLFGAFVSGITALIVFLLGVFFERRKIRDKVFSDLSSINDYLTFQINDLSTSAIKQRNEIMKFIRIMKLEKEEDYYLKMTASFNPQNIVEILNADLFRLMVLKRTGNKDNNTKAYSTFVNSITLLANLKSYIYDSFKDLNSKHQQYVNKYKDHLEKVVRTMEDFGTYAEQKNIKKGDDVLLDSYNEIISKLIQDEDYQDIHKTYKNLVIPMHNLCSNKRIVRGDIRANIIIKDLMQAKFYFENYLKLKSVYILEFCKTAKSINKETVIFNEMYKSLNSNRLLK